MPTISTRLRASVMADSSSVGLFYSLSRDIQGLQQEEDAWNGLFRRGVLPDSPAVAAVSGATVKVPAGLRLFSDGVIYQVLADTNFTPADASATIWLWGKPTVSRATPANYADLDAYSLTLQRTVGAAPLPPDGYTTVTAGVASATQQVGSTTGMAAGDLLYFVTAGVTRVVSSVTDGTHVVLTATVTTTTSEVVLEVGADLWILLARWATDGSGNVSGAVDSNPSAPALMPGKWLHGPNQLGWRSIAVAGTGTYTLSPGEARDALLKFTGVLTGARTVVFPFEAGRLYLLRNASTGAFSLTAKISGGTGGTVPQGESRLAYVDGADVVILDPGGVDAGGTATATATAGAATLNRQRGVITSETGLTTAAGADYVLTLTNDRITAGSIVLATANNGTNTTEGVAIHRVTPGSGSVVIRVRNTHASVAWNGSVKVAFSVQPA